MRTWDVNAVRVPLNEDCWLNINGSPAQYSGAAYQTAISNYVGLLLAAGIYPILELHWTAPGTTQATGQVEMPDMDHSVTFWQEVAAAYKSQDKVIFELFNEPFPDNNMDATSAWTCWRDGGTCPGITYQAAGMQLLLNTVRGQNATNFVLLGGIEYSNDLTQWLAYEPTDSANNHGAAWHVYDQTVCNNVSCWDTEGRAVAAKVPIVATEINAISACDGTFITEIMNFLDTPGNGIPAQNYLAWAWDTDSNPRIIADYTGTPQCNGATYKAHLLATPH